jgi:hypothetical protein
MRPAILAAALLVASIAGGSTHAQAAGPDSATADKLFRDGRAAADAGDFRTARDRFLESERLDPAPGTLLNIAECELHLGMLVNAREHFELAASGFPKADRRRVLAAGRASEIETRLARVTLRLGPGAPPGTVVARNGVRVEAAALGQPMLADPGRLEIVVTAPGRAPKSTTLMLAEGQAVEQTLTAGDPATVSEPAPAPVPATAPDDAASSPPATYPLRTLGFVVGGVGAAGLLTGTITGVLALGQASTAKAHCNTSTWACDSQGVSAASSSSSLATVSTVSFVAGAVLVGLGAYFVLGWKASPSSTALVLPPVIPTLDPHGAGAAFSRSF